MNNAITDTIHAEVEKLEKTVSNAIQEFRKQTGLRVADFDINWIDVTTEAERYRERRDRYVLGVVRADVTL